MSLEHLYHGETVDKWLSTLDGEQRARANLYEGKNTQLREIFEMDFQVRPAHFYEVEDGLRVPVYQFGGEDSEIVRVVKFGKNGDLGKYARYYSSMILGSYAGIGSHMVGVLDNDSDYSMIVQRMDVSFADKIEDIEDTECDTLKEFAYNAGQTFGSMVNMKLTGRGFCYRKNWVMPDSTGKKPFFKSTLFEFSVISKAEELKHLIAEMECNRGNIFNLLWQRGVMEPAVIGIRDAFSDDREGSKAREYVEKRYGVR